MKLSRVILIPLVPVLLLALLLAGNAVARSRRGETEPVEKNYRPAILYEEELYLYISQPPFGEIERGSFSYVATLTADVPASQLPIENLQSCGCPDLVNGGIYRTEKHPDYLFIHNEEKDTMVAFVAESAQS